MATSNAVARHALPDTPEESRPRVWPTWEEHYRELVNPDLVTALLREAVPALQQVGWMVQETSEGFARSLLPLNHDSTNQHGTHQAALLVLAADYTGGIALATILRGVPLSGVHCAPPDDMAALWLVGVEIKYKVPSTSDLLATAVVPNQDFDRIRDRYHSGEGAIETLEIRLENEGEEVATARMSYYLRRLRDIRPTTPDERPSALFRHRVKASARLIAGLRATENHQPDPLYCDPLSALAAGAHGRLLAERFAGILPPLREMVVARTRHIDDLLEGMGRAGLRQLVLVGAGLDLRAFRMPTYPDGFRVYEVDLPHMLAERTKAIASLPHEQAPCRSLVPINLELEDAGSALIEHGFDPDLPSLILFEGMSMYFEEKCTRAILASLRPLLRHATSRLWIDLVARSVVGGASGDPAVEDFLRGMEKLGEPFVFGVDNPRPLFDELGYRVVGTARSDCYRPGEGDPLFALYNFYVLAGAGPGDASLIPG